MTPDQSPRLWYSPGARSSAAHITLLEAGVEPELILAKPGHERRVRSYKSETKSPSVGS